MHIDKAILSLKMSFSMDKSFEKSKSQACTCLVKKYIYNVNLRELCDVTSFSSPEHSKIFDNLSLNPQLSQTSSILKDALSHLA